MRILNELADDRERSVSILESVMNSLSQSILSQYLGRLRRANIVRTRRKSQTIYYLIDDTDRRSPGINNSVNVCLTIDLRQDRPARPRTLRVVRYSHR